MSDDLAAYWFATKLFKALEVETKKPAKPSAREVVEKLRDVLSRAGRSRNEFGFVLCRGCRQEESQPHFEGCEIATALRLADEFLKGEGG